MALDVLGAKSRGNAAGELQVNEMAVVPTGDILRFKVSEGDMSGPWSTAYVTERIGPEAEN